MGYPFTEFLSQLIVAYLSILFTWYLANKIVHEYQKNKDRAEIRAKVVQNIVNMYNKARVLGLSGMGNYNPDNIQEYFVDVINIGTELRTYNQLYFRKSAGKKEYIKKLSDFENFSLKLARKQPSGWENQLDNLFAEFVVLTSLLKIDIDGLLSY